MRGQVNKLLLISKDCPAGSVLCVHVEHYAKRKKILTSIVRLKRKHYIPFYFVLGKKTKYPTPLYSPLFGPQTLISLSSYSIAY